MEWLKNLTWGLATRISDRLFVFLELLSARSFVLHPVCLLRGGGGCLRILSRFFSRAFDQAAYQGCFCTDGAFLPTKNRIRGGRPTAPLSPLLQVLDRSTAPGIWRIDHPSPAARSANLRGISVGFGQSRACTPPSMWPFVVPF